MSLHTYRRITLATLFLLAFIIVSGAAVRLTGSGLGCTDWPTCEGNQFFPAGSLHPMVEFINRMITGLVSLAVIFAVLGSRFLKPFHKDLWWLSLGLVGGVVAQIILGALVVKLELTVPAVMGHFLLSLLLVWNALWLHHRVVALCDDTAPSSPPSVWFVAQHRWRWLLSCLGLLVMVIGTLVTGAGPHAGDEDAERLAINISTIVRVHSTAAWVLMALTLWCAIRCARSAETSNAAVVLRQKIQRLLLLIVLQGAIGYWQYFTGIPAWLVGIHMVGTTCIWIAIVDLHLWANSQERDPLQKVPHV